MGVERSKQGVGLGLLGFFFFLGGGGGGAGLWEFRGYRVSQLRELRASEFGAHAGS